MKSKLSVFKNLYLVCKDVSMALNPDMSTISIDRYISYLVTELTSRGEKSCVDLGKKHYNIAVKYSLYRKFDPIKFRKSDNEGFPNSLKSFKKHLRSDNPNEIKAVLTLLRAVYGFHITPCPQVDSIVQPGVKPDSLPWLSNFNDFLHYWSKPFKIRLPKWNPTYLYGTTKNGPSGPALISAGQDIINLLKDDSLSKHFQRYCMSVKNTILLTYAKQVWATMKGSIVDIKPLSKLAFLPEGGGKTRTIAMVDYWTQSALLPLHAELMKILKRHITDGTYNQGRISDIVCNWTKINKPVYCFDLTTATDRFPVFIQKIVLSHLVGPETAHHWSMLLTDRQFESSLGKVRYNSGQPMGILSSWAAFAVTHHAIIEYCAFNIGINSFRDYIVLGDDVAIANDLVAKEYGKIMNQLGVKLSIDKCIFPEEGQPSSAEIAKRLFTKGMEVSPIPPDLILQAKRNSLLFPSLVREFCFRGGDSSLKRWVPLATDWHPKKDANVRLLLSIPPGFPGSLFKDHEDWMDSSAFVKGWYDITSNFSHNEIKLEYMNQRLISLNKKSDSMMKILFRYMVNESLTEENFSEFEIDLSGSFGKFIKRTGVAIPNSPSAINAHPIAQVAVLQLQKLMDLSNRLYDDEITGALDEREYVPDVLFVKFFRTKQELRQIRTSSLCLEVIKSLNRSASRSKET